jgi:choline dehydrogenase
LSQDVINRKNLDIAVHAYVNRVLFEGNEAVGIEVQKTRDGPKYHIGAKKEVILCGGTINTPQLLKLSGIGTKAELEKHNIKVVKELSAVGEHLKDHFCTSGILCKAKPGYTLDYLTNDIKAIPSLLRWFLTGGGPVTSNVGEAAAFLRSADPPVKVGGEKVVDYGSGGIGPDIEIIGSPLAYVNHGADKAPPGTDVYSLVPIGLRPQSEGTITLKSDNVFDAAIIDPKYWSDKDDNDRKVLLVGLRVCLKIIRSEALKKYLEPVETNDDPDSYFWPYSASDDDAITDDQLRKWMGKTAFTLYQ